MVTRGRVIGVLAAVVLAAGLLPARASGTATSVHGAGTHCDVGARACETLTMTAHVTLGSTGGVATYLRTADSVVRAIVLDCVYLVERSDGHEVYAAGTSNDGVRYHIGIAIAAGGSEFRVVTEEFESWCGAALPEGATASTVPGFSVVPG
jgi:hypothetical protein